MKRLLISLALIIVVVAGVGYYRGWFEVNSGGSITVDKEKIQDDKDDAQSKVKDLKE